MFLTGQPLRSAYRVHRPRRPRRLVPVRSQDGAARRRASLVHPRRRASTSPSSSEAEAGARERAQPALGGARYRRRAGGGAEPVGEPSSASTGRASCISGYSFDEVRGRYFWDLFPVPEEARGMPGTPRRGSRRGSSAPVTRATGSRAGRLPAPDRLVEHRRCPGRAAPAHVITTGHRHHRTQADGDGAARDQRPGAAADRPGPARRAGPAPDRHRVHEQGAGAAARRGRTRRRRPTRRKIVRLVNDAINKTRELARGLLPVFSDADRPHVGAPAMGRRGRGPVPRLLPVRVSRADPDHRRRAWRRTSITSPRRR